MPLTFDLRTPPGQRGEGRNTMESERGQWKKWAEPVFGDGQPGSRKLILQNEGPGR